MPLPETKTALDRSMDPLLLVRGIAGALAGAAIGFGLFTLLVRFGLYALALPGASVGLVGGFCARGRSPLLGAICAVIAVVVVIISEWWNFPFNNDHSFAFFIRNMRDLQFPFWISLLLGGGLAFWLGQGSERTLNRGGT